MAQKKERGRFTIKLNENDPAHEKAICLLEHQRPHSKAQFIVDALLFFAAHREEDKPGTSMVPDRTAIEAIVRDILRQQTNTPVPVQMDDLPQRADAPDESFSLIADTLSAFRGE